MSIPSSFDDKLNNMSQASHLGHFILCTSELNEALPNSALPNQVLARLAREIVEANKRFPDVFLDNTEPLDRLKEKISLYNTGAYPQIIESVISEFKKNHTNKPIIQTTPNIQATPFDSRVNAANQRSVFGTSNMPDEISEDGTLIWKKRNYGFFMGDFRSLFENASKKQRFEDCSFEGQEQGFGWEQMTSIEFQNCKGPNLIYCYLAKNTKELSFKDMELPQKQLRFLFLGEGSNPVSQPQLERLTLDNVPLINGQVLRLLEHPNKANMTLVFSNLNLSMEDMIALTTGGFKEVVFNSINKVNHPLDDPSKRDFPLPRYSSPSLPMKQGWMSWIAKWFIWPWNWF